MLTLLQTQDLRVGQKKEPCIGFIQENSIENSIQDCLLYILIPNGPYELFLAYPNDHVYALRSTCVSHIV